MTFGVNHTMVTCMINAKQHIIEIEKRGILEFELGLILKRFFVMNYFDAERFISSTLLVNVNDLIIRNLLISLH